MKKILILLIIFSFLTPFVASARGGLVPCDGACPAYKTDCVPCTFCHLLQFIIGLTRFALVDIFFPLAGLLIFYGGIMMVLGEKTYGKGKDIIKNTVIGLVIALVAFVIVNTIIIGLAQATGSFDPKTWWTIKCG